MAYEVTPLEAQFCEAVIKLRSPVRAYHSVAGGPDVPWTLCESRAAALMRQPGVKAHIKQLREDAQNLKYQAGKITVEEVLRQFLVLANADPNELISLTRGCCRYCHGESHQYHWTQREYLRALSDWEGLDGALRTPRNMPLIGGGLDFDGTREPHPSCPECFGEGVERVTAKDTTQLSEGGQLLFQGVKVTKDGLEIKMADRQKALDSVARILGAYKDTVDLTAKLSGAIAAVHQAVSNPAEAQQAYLAMIANDGPAR